MFWMDDILRFYAEERERRPRHEKGFRTEHCETLLSIKLSIKVGLRCVYTNYYEVFNVMKSKFYSSRVKNVQKGRFFYIWTQKKIHIIITQGHARVGVREREVVAGVRKDKVREKQQFWQDCPWNLEGYAWGSFMVIIFKFYLETNDYLQSSAGGVCWLLGKRD